MAYILLLDVTQPFLNSTIRHQHSFGQKYVMSVSCISMAIAEDSAKRKKPGSLQSKVFFTSNVFCKIHLKQSGFTLKCQSSVTLPMDIQIGRGETQLHTWQHWRAQPILIGCAEWVGGGQLCVCAPGMTSLRYAAAHSSLSWEAGQLMGPVMGKGTQKEPPAVSRGIAWLC